MAEAGTAGAAAGGGEERTGLVGADSESLQQMLGDLVEHLLHEREDVRESASRGLLMLSSQTPLGALVERHFLSQCCRALRSVCAPNSALQLAHFLTNLCALDRTALPKVLALAPASAAGGEDADADLMGAVVARLQASIAQLAEGTGARTPGEFRALQGLVDALLKLLGNLTISAEASEAFMATDGAARVQTLLTPFGAVNPQAEPAPPAPPVQDSAAASAGASSSSSSGEEAANLMLDIWAFAANLFCNVTQTEAGRAFFLQHDDEARDFQCPLRVIVQQLRSQNNVRRRGCISVLRNCCFVEEELMYIMSEVRALPTLLYLLVAGSDTFSDEERMQMDPILWMVPPTQLREKVHAVRKGVYDTLLLLCATRESREYLRANAVYPILRNSDQAFQDEELSTVASDIVNFLQREEASSSSASSSGSNDPEAESRADDGAADTAQAAVPVVEELG